jgi:hypothetical protein
MFLRILLAGLAVMGLDRPEPSVPPSVDEEAIELAISALSKDLRVERFVLERTTLDARGRTAVDVVGFVERRRLVAEKGVQLECDVRFLRTPNTDGTRDSQRISHVECHGETGPRCLWRELGPAGGRSVAAEWSRDGRALDVVEWGPGGTQRGTLVGARGVVMPLFLAELVRDGKLASGSVTVFDPLGRTLEPLWVRTIYDAESSKRVVELTRGDGTLFQRFTFGGVDLVSFQWQEGNLVARRVERDEYDREIARNSPSEVEVGGPKPQPAAGPRVR